MNLVLATFFTKGGPTDIPTAAGIDITYVTVLVSAIKFEGAISRGVPASAIYSPTALFVRSMTTVPTAVPVCPGDIIVIALSAVVGREVRGNLTPGTLQVPGSHILSFAIVDVVFSAPAVPLDGIGVPVARVTMHGVPVTFYSYEWLMGQFRVRDTLLSSKSGQYLTPVALQ